MCAGVTVYNAIKAASIQPGQILGEFMWDGPIPKFSNS